MFNISKLVNKITERGSSRDGGEPPPPPTTNNSTSTGGSGSMSFVTTDDEQHSEGFLCPQCMRAFPSSEILEAHYNATHGQNDAIVEAQGASEEDESASGSDDLQLLREQILTLQRCLAEEKSIVEELKNHVVNIQVNHRESAESQEKQFENDKALLNSELLLLRNQLTASLSQVTSMSKEKEAILAQNEALKGSVDEQKSNGDQNSVLEEKLVSTQQTLDQVLISHKKEIAALELKFSQFSATKTSLLTEKVEKAEGEVVSLGGIVELQKKEIHRLNDLVDEGEKTAAEKLAQVATLLTETTQRKSSLETSCATLTEEVKRLNDQQAELCQKFEGGEGAKAALEALQKENNLIKENVSALTQKNSELSGALENVTKSAASSKHDLTLQLDTARTKLNSLMNTKDDLLAANVALKEQIKEAEKKEQLGKGREDELHKKIEEALAQGKLGEEKATKLENSVKEKDELLTKSAKERDHLEKQLEQKVAALAEVKTKFESEIAADKLNYQKLLEAKETQDAKVVTLTTKLTAETTALSTLQDRYTSLEKKLENKSIIYDDIVTKCLDLDKNVAQLMDSLDQAEQRNLASTKISEQHAQRVQELEENLKNSELRGVEIKTTFEAQITLLNSLLESEKETNSVKVKEIESVLNFTNDEMLVTKQSLENMVVREKEGKERFEGMETEMKAALEKLEIVEGEKEALKVQTDAALRDKLELEKRVRSAEDEKALLLEKCLSSESEMEQLALKINGMQRKLDDSYAALQELGRENQSLQMESAKLQGRKWADDSVVTTCPTCSKEFSLTLRKHHCRHCGQIFCSDCSSRTAAVPSCKKPARVCDPCYQELLTK